jgi:pimeloyl-ACP methyl ester carboxylesterase
MPEDYTSHFITAHDGLKLHIRDYGPRDAANLPVVCLPGLARTSADFHPLAVALSADAEHPRRVIAMDCRGRGRSGYDPNPDNYNLAVELADVITVLAALRIASAVFVGTSRGGILTMLLAVAQPAVIAGAVLNDIGPVIEAQGLARIKGYVGKLSRPENFEDAVEILRRLFAAQFPKLTSEEWTAFAQRTFEERDGKLVPSYDPALAKTLQDFDLERPVPALWKEFDALARVPVMVIRGANSDLLSAATVQVMRQRRDRMDVVEVPDQGHAPLLADSETIRRIAAFITECDALSRRQAGEAKLVK